MIAMLEWFPPAVTFLVVASASFGLYLLFRRNNALPDISASTETAPEKDAATVADHLLESSKLQPDMHELRQELRSAGVYEPNALAEFTSLRAVAALLVLACTALAMFLVEDQYAARAFLIGVPFAAIAAYSATYGAASWRKRQTRMLERDLPLAIDLQVLCLSAGQGLVAALRQTATQLKRPSPTLARELAIVCQHAELHSLEHALKQWSDRAASPHVQNLAMLLMQSERLGTDSAATLQELATSYRISSRQRAEAQANRTSFWMLFPSVFCFWVASAIILVGPTYQEFFRYHHQSGPLLNQPGETLRSITNTSPNPISATASVSGANPTSKSK